MSRRSLSSSRKRQNKLFIKLCDRCDFSRTAREEDWLFVFALLFLRAFFLMRGPKMSPSFFCKKKNKNGRDRPWLAPDAAKKEKKRVGGKKTRERKYVLRHGGALSFLRRLGGKTTVSSKKKKKKRRRNVVCEPQTSSSFKKNEREKERTSREKRVNNTSTNPKKEVQNLQIARARKDART